MLAFLSPAKSLDYKSAIPEFATTEPRFHDESMQLAAAAAQLGAARLQAIMDISENLAVLNAERYSNFENLPTRAAIYAFAGDVYVGFEAKSLAEEAVLFAQDHVRMLSGLYGLLRPLDEIRPYRLEMGTRWAPESGDLYGHWGTRIAELTAADLDAEGSDTIINLASKEYWAAVDGKLRSDIRVITIDFRDTGPDGNLRFNSFAAKRARGYMARYICEHRLTDPEALKGFDTDGYAFEPEGSDDKLWRFVRR